MLVANENTTVADIFRRAQQIKRESREISYKDLKAKLVAEFKGGPFPPVYNLTIPEQDGRAPEEDWSAGLSLVLRGIQQKNWPEIANGIALSLEQTENYEQARGSSYVDRWHDRTIGIKEPLTKGVNKWMPKDLAALAERSTKKEER